ncbi:MAG: hypothetical protein NT128_05920 [Proteobacteria bacterium]|nr:hypothetical protein [Pseudomonadota bacterium]
MPYPAWLEALAKKVKITVPLPTNQRAKRSVEKPKEKTQARAASSASSASVSRRDSLADVVLEDEEEDDQEDQEDAEVASQIRLDGLELTPAISSKEEKEAGVQRVMPRGMRIFHSHAQTFRTSFTGLSGKHIRTLSSLMNKKEFTPVTYADFASLWKAINGKDSISESTGGSHKALLDADGKVVAGIFAHNANMEYTRRTVPYLRGAIDLLGISLAQFE